MDTDVETFDFPTRERPSRSPVWRKRAVELAYEKHLIGQARVGLTDDATGLVYYNVTSASESADRVVVYAPTLDATVCTCEAGIRDHPCSHAGAVYLLLRGLAPERTRDASGMTDGLKLL